MLEHHGHREDRRQGIGQILAGDVEASDGSAFLRGVSFQLAVDRGIASWKLTPLLLGHQAAADVLEGDDEAVVIDVLVNDTDPDGDTLTALPGNPPGSGCT